MILRSFYLVFSEENYYRFITADSPIFCLFGFVVNGRCNAIGCTFVWTGFGMFWNLQKQCHTTE